MKAVRLGSGGPWLDPSVDEPSPGPRDAIVRPMLVGLGGFEAEAASGGVGDPHRGEFIPGREFVGVVERAAASPHKADPPVGKRVVGSAEVLCGECDMCRAGLSSHCRDRVTLGAPQRDGVLAERFAIPAINLVSVPDSVADEAAALALPLARAVHTARLMRVEGRPYITVLGRGAEAILTAQVMARLNASVRLVTGCETTLTACERLGLKHRPQREVGRRADQDIVVDCAGSTEGLETAVRMVRPRGKIVSQRDAPLGEHGGASVDLSTIIENELELLGSRGARLVEAVEMLEAGEVTVEGLITRRVTFDRAAEALRGAADPSQIKVVVEM